VKIVPLTLATLGTHWCTLSGVGLLSAKKSNVVELTFEPNATMPNTGAQLSTNVTHLEVARPFELNCLISEYPFENITASGYFYVNFYFQYGDTRLNLGYYEVPR